MLPIRKTAITALISLLYGLFLVNYAVRFLAGLSVYPEGSGTFLILLLTYLTFAAGYLAVILGTALSERIARRAARRQEGEQESLRGYAGAVSLVFALFVLLRAALFLTGASAQIPSSPLYEQAILYAESGTMAAGNPLPTLYVNLCALFVTLCGEATEGLFLLQGLMDLLSAFFLFWALRASSGRTAALFYLLLQSLFWPSVRSVYTVDASHLLLLSFSFGMVSLSFLLRSLAEEEEEETGDARRKRQIGWLILTAAAVGFCALLDAAGLCLFCLLAVPCVLVRRDGRSCVWATPAAMGGAAVIFLLLISLYYGQLPWQAVLSWAAVYPVWFSPGFVMEVTPDAGLYALCALGGLAFFAGHRRRADSVSRWMFTALCFGWLLPLLGWSAADRTVLVQAALCALFGVAVQDMQYLGIQAYREKLPPEEAWSADGSEEERSVRTIGVRETSFGLAGAGGMMARAAESGEEAYESPVPYYNEETGHYEIPGMENTGAGNAAAENRNAGAGTAAAEDPDAGAGARSVRETAQAFPDGELLPEYGQEEELQAEPVQYLHNPLPQPQRREHVPLSYDLPEEETEGEYGDLPGDFADGYDYEISEEDDFDF
ncbi:MAG: hypothetical protein Q4C60_00790 [Eubacteriales bacterium]|nr:hypothetical protein [Eubacteriales bacterium]